jgi:LysM repeat protein
MAHRGELFGEGPAACPFVALELDRDRRSDKPDYRHRCFAEPTPQPRAIAHQQAYCLSTNFAACPIFMDWAVRAAARPVPVPDGFEARATVVAEAPADAALELEPEPDLAPEPLPAEAPEPLPAEALPDDIPPVLPAPDEPWPATAFAPPESAAGPEQLSAFEPPSAFDAVPLPPPLPEPAATYAPVEPPAAASPAPDFDAFSVGPPVPPADDEAPVPGFLTGRRVVTGDPGRAPAAEPRRASGARPEAPTRPKVKREDLLPSWELDGRYGAQAAGDDGRGDRFGGLITTIAVVAILGLGVAGVIFLPGLLAGGGPATTPTPALTVGPTDLPLLTPTPAATTTPIASAAPTGSAEVSPMPTATPRLYRIKSGDQLSRIARRFHVSVDEIMAVNPQISDPDHIEIGQLIVIPQPLPTAAP